MRNLKIRELEKLEYVTPYYVMILNSLGELLQKQVHVTLISIDSFLKRLKGEHIYTFDSITEVAANFHKTCCNAFLICMYYVYCTSIYYHDCENRQMRTNVALCIIEKYYHRQDCEKIKNCFKILEGWFDQIIF